MKAAILMILYAVGLVFAGVIAFNLAPEGASAITALAVPAVAGAMMVICAVLSLRIKSNYRQGMVGIHAGLVFPLLFAILFGMRAVKSDAASAEFRDLRAEYELRQTNGDESTFRDFLIEQQYSAGIADGSIDGTKVTLDKFREKPGKLLDHDKAYLAATLWNLAVWSGFAFVAILLDRPTPDKRGKGEPEPEPVQPPMGSDED